MSSKDKSSKVLNMKDSVTLALIYEHSLVKLLIQTALYLIYVNRNWLIIIYDRAVQKSNAEIYIIKEAFKDFGFFSQ